MGNRQKRKHWMILKFLKSEKRERKSQMWNEFKQQSEMLCIKIMWNTYVLNFSWFMKYLLLRDGNDEYM